MGFGVVKLEWLRTLKNSARNWVLKRSPKRVFLRRERSSSLRPGPVRVSRPRVPTAPPVMVVPAALVVESGAVKAVGSNHLATVWG